MCMCMGMCMCIGIGGHLGGQAEATAERRAVRRQATPQRAAHLLAGATLEHRPHALEPVDLPRRGQARLLRRVKRADAAPERLLTQAQPQQLGAIRGRGGAMAASLPRAQVLGAEVVQASHQEVVGQAKQAGSLVWRLSCEGVAWRLSLSCEGRLNIGQPAQRVLAHL